ncbi:MAG: hypothetical protein AAGF10_01980 [Verrucomicrobiota bacterium]
MQKIMQVHKVMTEVRGWLTLLLVLALGAVAMSFGFKLARAHMAEDIYRQRLTHLAEDYANLRADYERALQQSLVTELLVEDGQVSVSYLRQDGQQVELLTPLNANREIYVDFFVQGNRVGIRRIFDSSMAPEAAIVLDEPWDLLAQEDDETAFGRAVYRRLKEGRWAVTMTGNGSLGLEPARDNGPLLLNEPPPLVTPEIALSEGDEAIDAIALEDVVSWLMQKVRLTEDNPDS